MTYAENIMRVFESATESEYNEGMTWYNEQHDIALALSPDDVWRGAGVIAGYSPNNKWERNLMLATEVLTTGIVRTDYLPVMVPQIQRIMDGEHPLDVFRGQKVRAFTAAIATNGESDIATIDRHAHDVCIGHVTEVGNGKKKIAKSVFNTMVMHYQQAALEAGIKVAQMQAVTWVVWRNRKGGAA
jgi:hypothetical protein